MTKELTYALITPYSLFKSRTGGILGRLLAHSKLNLLGARMFVFSDEFVDQYLDMACPPEIDPMVEVAWRAYLNRNLRESNSWHYAPRCMVLLMGGRDAVNHLKDDVIGSFTEAPLGDTIRGTFGDFIRNEDGSLRYFEPAVLTAPSSERAVEHLRLLARHSESDGGALTSRIQFDNKRNIETTLVLIRPDDIARHSRRPGGLIDRISRTGLKIVGARLVRMTVSIGEKLYGPLRDQFRQTLKGDVAQQVYSRLHGAFAFPFIMQDAHAVAELLNERNATAEFNRIIQYMCGVSPEDIADEQGKNVPGGAHCMALLYQGPDAISKVQSVLSGVDPTQIIDGPSRSDFARDLLRNGAHASTSVIDALRSREILSLNADTEGPSDFQRVIETYLEGLK